VDLSIDTKGVNRRNWWTLVTCLFFVGHDNGGRQRRWKPFSSLFSLCL